MKEIWEHVENFFDKMIVPALIVLLIYVIVDVFFTDFKYSYENYFFYADMFIISIFVGDLSFKFKRAASWKGFLRREWLEIIAIIPFFWIFRLVESIARVGELVQEIIHIVTRGGRLARLLAALGLVGTRDNRFANFVRKITGSERFEEAAKFFSHPKEHRS